MAKKHTFPHKVAGWKGYTLDEMRYQKAYLDARIQIEKEQLSRDAAEMRHGFGTTGSIVSRVGTLMDYAGYAIVAYRVVKQASGLLRRLRH